MRLKGLHYKWTSPQTPTIKSSTYFGKVEKTKLEATIICFRPKSLNCEYVLDNLLPVTDPMNHLNLLR